MKLKNRNNVLSVCCLIFLLCFITSCFATRANEATRVLQEVERRGPPDDTEDSSNNNSRKNHTSTLADVWLCLVFSLGWTVWMVAAHFPEKVVQYSTEATMVHGNVLESVLYIGDNDIPMYRVIVDYILRDESQTQVRKEFITESKLEEGFANVEILVLPTDPTSGVLKQDWEREYAVFLDTQPSRKRTKMSSLVLGALLVIVSIAGACMAVLKLPVELTTWGWVSIVIGVVLLWPVAILLWINGNVISNLATQSKEAKGVVIRGQQPPLPFSLNPCASRDANDGSSPQHSPRRRKSRESTTVKPPAIELSRISTRDVQLPPSLLRDRVKVVDESSSEAPPPTMGCYFINLPFGKQRSNFSGRSSMSSVSSPSDAQHSNNLVHPPSQHNNLVHPPPLDRTASHSNQQIV